MGSLRSHVKVKDRCWSRTIGMSKYSRKTHGAQAEAPRRKGNRLPVRSDERPEPWAEGAALGRFRRSDWAHRQSRIERDGRRAMPTPKEHDPEPRETVPAAPRRKALHPPSGGRATPRRSSPEHLPVHFSPDHRAGSSSPVLVAPSLRSGKSLVVEGRPSVG